MGDEEKKLLKSTDPSDAEETSTESQVAVTERKKRVLSGNVPLGTLLLEKIGVCNCNPRTGCVRVCVDECSMCVCDVCPCVCVGWGKGECGEGGVCVCVDVCVWMGKRRVEMVCVCVCVYVRVCGRGKCRDGGVCV